MENINVVFCLIALVYFFNILRLIYGFSKVKTFQTSAVAPKTKFSIVVPFRNEASTLPKLLHSITLLDYPADLFEVILVDDESEEKFQITNYKLQILVLNNTRISNSPKKDAINTAIQHAKNDWIITTDADCIVQENWLRTFDDYIQKNHPRMIAAGVFYKTSGSFLDAFQQLDFLSLQGTTIGSFGIRNPFMCNGANFCYQKTYFQELDGFEGNDSIASGDDVFLLQKAIQYDKSQVRFLKSSSAIVQTQTEKNWKGLFYQRVRWASKTGNYSSFYSKQLGVSVLLMNSTWLIVVGCWLVGKSRDDSFLFFIGLKFLIDFILLYQTSRFFRTRLRYVLLSSLTYPFFCVLVAVYSFFGSYEWKGRTFRS